MIAFILFYNKANGIQRHFAWNSEYKHCDVICHDGESYILFQFSSKGIQYRTIRVKNVESMLRHLRVIPELVGIVAVEVERAHCFPWFPWWVRSCNEFIRYLIGIDIGFTLTPRHMIKKLLKYNGKRNFQVLYAWRRDSWDYSQAVTMTQQIEPMP
jgi:hypothetical protein